MGTEIYNMPARPSITIDDLVADESLSLFAGVLFKKTNDNRDIENIDFTCTEFEACEYDNNLVFRNCDFTGAEGDLPCNMESCVTGVAIPDRSTRIAKLPHRLEITTDAVDTADPINGMPDIQADGISTCTITIKKVANDNSYLTGAEDDDIIEIRTTKGELSALRVNLVNGSADVILTSIATTSVAEIFASASGLKSAYIQIQFAP